MNFLEQVKADFIANGVRMAQQMNQTAEQRFLDAARDWARNGGTSGEPRPDEAVQAVFSFDDFFTMKIAGTGRPVSTIDPKSFLPSYGTDEASVGGPVGGPRRRQVLRLAKALRPKEPAQRKGPQGFLAARLGKAADPRFSGALPRGRIPAAHLHDVGC